MTFMPGSELAERQTHHGIDLSRLKIIDSATSEELPIISQCLAAARQLYGEVIIEVNASDFFDGFVSSKEHQQKIKELKADVSRLESVIEGVRREIND